MANRRLWKTGVWTPDGLHVDSDCKGFGGPGEIRTHDLFHAMEARSQLRHRPILGGSQTHTHRASVSLNITLSTGVDTALCAPPTMRKMHFRRVPVALLLLCLIQFGM